MGPKELAKNKPTNMKVFCVCENRWLESRCRRCVNVPSCAFVNGKIADELEKEVSGMVSMPGEHRHTPPADEKKEPKHKKQAQ